MAGLDQAGARSAALTMVRLWDDTKPLKVIEMAVEEDTGGLKCSLTAYVRDEKCSPVVVGRPRGATAAGLNIHTY